jgi:deoxyribodipyrimidine photo-lyase
MRGTRGTVRDLTRTEPVPGLEKRRVEIRGGAPRKNSAYVLYWMQAQRRAAQNVALDEAIREANRLGLPVVVYEGLRPDYPGANLRIHTFVIEGMRDNAADASARGLRYVAYAPARDRVDRGTLARLASRAAVVVTDESPGFIFARQTAALARQIDCPLVTIDGCGVVPLRELAKREWSAATIRPKIHALLGVYLRPLDEERIDRPDPDLDVDLPDALDPSDPVDTIVARSEVDASVAPSPIYRGGRAEALRALERFLADRLDGYAERRRDAGQEGTSRLSPYLHFGFVGALEVGLAAGSAGAPEEDTAAFLEELIVRRELCYNFVFYEPRHTEVASLPDWARKTLEKHEPDERANVSERQIERAETYNEVWNLTQRELLATGEIHNAARMLWGKKILEWAQTPQRAVNLMIRLHHRYALDGRNPATYTNILWCLGLHDRAWGPERPIFGTVRYMSSDAFRRKHDAKAYAQRIESFEARARAGPGAGP